ncbi:MAG: hypothetical protein C0423_03255 [Methylibium sp.]|nr:hypothetical protein [Methylibium sp.]
MKITILSPVQHDDKVLEPGDKVDLPQKAAEALIAAGAAEGRQGAAPRAADADTQKSGDGAGGSDAGQGSEGGAPESVG